MTKKSYEPRPLGQKEIVKYVKGDGDRCPYCGSTQIAQTGELDHHRSVIYQDVRCMDCTMVWTDEYRLTGIS